MIDKNELLKVAKEIKQVTGEFGINDLAMILSDGSVQDKTFDPSIIKRRQWFDEIYASFPENPYPKSIFPMSDEEYVKAIPDERLRTAISGYMARFGWNIAFKQMKETIENVLLE
jgi:hypothetical protein